MRIVGGSCRHRLIKWPQDKNTRPTKDMVREAVFSALSLSIVDATILDLFAGSGSLGLEALSRGARSAIFVDKSPEAINIIKDNLKTLNLDNGHCLKGDYKSALESFKADSIKFDVIFLDPPYELKIIDEIIDDILAAHLLNERGIIVVETDYPISEDDRRFEKNKQYRYGRTLVMIKRRTL